MIKDGTRILEGAPKPPLIGNYKSRQDVVRVCKRLIRRLGHLMPKGAWLETFGYPGTRLTARCRHCSRIFMLAGDPNVGNGKWKVAPQYMTTDEPGFVASYNLDPWVMFEQISNAAEIDTSMAFGSGRNAVSSDRIGDVGPRDWDGHRSLRNFFTQMLGSPQDEDDLEKIQDPEAKEAKLIEKKLAKIEKRFYCGKVKTWL